MDSLTGECQGYPQFTQGVIIINIMIVIRVGLFVSVLFGYCF